MKSLFLAFFISLFSVPSYSEMYSSNISFQHVLENKDVVIGVVLSIAQDSDGFMWFGGENALIRFDGYTLKPFNLKDEGDLQSIGKPVTLIPHIYEDSRGRIWIASGNGLLRYDRQLEQLVRLPDHESLSKSPLSEIGTRKVAELPDGKLAVATYSGLYIVDSDSGEGRVYHEVDGMSAGRVNIVYYAGDNVLWAGTGSGLSRINIKTKEIEAIYPFSEKPNSVSDNGVSSILPGVDGKLWLGTDRGLIAYDPNTSAYKRYAHDEQDESSFSGGDIWDLFEDSNGFIWIATDGGGLNMFDPKSEVFAHFKSEAGRRSSLNSNVVRTVVEDRNGDLWVGNYPSGVNFFDKSSAAINAYTNSTNNQFSLAYNSVMSVSGDSKGNIWVGTDGAGLDYFNRDQGTFTHYVHEKDNINSLGSNAVLSLLSDSNNILWGGTWAGGVFRMDLNDANKVTRLPGDARRVVPGVSKSMKLNNDKVWCIVEDYEGIIWFCTHEGGVNRYDQASGEFTHYTADNADSQSLNGNQVWSIFEDSKKTLWVGTTIGLGVLDRNTGKFKNYDYIEGDPKSVSNPSILSMFEDSKGRFWLGSNAGLNLYNPDSDDFTSYGIKDGFANDSIRSITEDKQGRLWMGTNSGVVAFNPDTLKVKNYNRESGSLIGGFNYQAALFTERGEAVFGGKKGLRVYKTNEMQDNQVLPSIVLTELRIFSDAVAIGGHDGLLTSSVNHTDAITLDYTQSVFEIDFAALNFRDSGKNKYAYMLEGFDKDWLDVGDQRRAKYTNLDAGVYLFRVKGSNNDGVWNEEGKSIKLIQLPPPWETWWAYTLYGLFICGLIFWFLQSQRRKRQLIEQQNRILEARVAERTVELRAKNDDIQAMLSNMHQGLFTIENGGVIHPEYSEFLESIFESTEIAGRNVIELLFSQSTLGGDTVNQIKEAVASMVGEDEMNFQFNSHLLVAEYMVSIDDNTKNLHLSWDPIIVDDVVAKLMVTVRDVTELKQMEAESELKQRELDIIIQLLNVAASKFLSFETSAKNFIEENRQAVDRHSSVDADAIALLFRNMHTIKGNCRTYGFAHLSDIVHEVETVYSSIKSQQGPAWDQASLLEDLVRVEQGLAEYSDVYRRVLGRGGSKSSSRGDGFWMTGSVFGKIQSHVDKNEMSELKSYLPQLSSKSIGHVLGDVISSLPSIAQQLGKPDPEIIIDDESVLIAKDGFELCTDVFAHILRNCVDHGIELADERLGAGKPERGIILINAIPVDGKLDIFVNDDGKGINITKLFEKGVKSGVWAEGDTPSNHEVAQLIFRSGVSTKDVVTDISGRGVGMDAVKEFLTKAGGGIEIILQNTSDVEKGFVPFELLVQLPSRLFVTTDTKSP